MKWKQQNGRRQEATTDDVKSLRQAKRKTGRWRRREQKAEALALDLLVDPLQMRAPPIIRTLLPLAAQANSHICARVAHTQKSLGSKTEKEVSFLERRGERKRGRREIII